MQAAETISAAHIMGERRQAIPVLGHPEVMWTVNPWQQSHDKTVNQDLQLSNWETANLSRLRFGIGHRVTKLKRMRNAKNADPAPCGSLHKITTTAVQRSLP